MQLPDTSTTLAPKDAHKDGKPMVSLIPMDLLIEFLEPAYREGVQKYERESWRRGFVMSDLYDATQRHLKAFFFECEDYDPETLEAYQIKKHHLAGALFSLLSALHTQKYHPHLDNRRDPVTGNLKNLTNLKSQKDIVDNEPKSKSFP